MRHGFGRNFDFDFSFVAIGGFGGAHNCLSLRPGPTRAGGHSVNQNVA
jgi:hypothetical protein